MSDAWIQTFTGRTFPILEPSAEDIDIKDIAHALSNLCRFAGHTSIFYSVAQHSVMVSQNVQPQFSLAGLLHDAPEAYCVDVPRPLKHSGFLDGYAVIEDRIWEAISKKYGLPLMLDPDVKRADNVLLFTEQRDLMSRPPKPWKDPYPRLQ